MPESELVARQVLEEHWPQAVGFFDRAEKEAASLAVVGFRALFASVPRRLGQSARLEVAPPAGLDAARPHWTLTDYARLWLVLRALGHLPESQGPDWLLQLFEAGELGEQVSILRALPQLPGAARFVETGVQACRTNARGVFEAIVCENAFLAEHFPPLNFNQAVMKALFTEVAVRRIEQLERRIGPELSRMAAGYASERRAAGRAVPDDAEYLAHYAG